MAEANRQIVESGDGAAPINAEIFCRLRQMRQLMKRMGIYVRVGLQLGWVSKTLKMEGSMFP